MKQHYHPEYNNPAYQAIANGDSDENGVGRLTAPVLTINVPMLPAG